MENFGAKISGSRRAGFLDFHRGRLQLNSYLYRPDADGKFPVILGVVQLLEISPDGAERLLTRGWLGGSQRKIDPDRSKPWAPYHTHERREPLKPNEIYEFNIEIRPYGIRLRPGYRLAIRISGRTAIRRRTIYMASPRVMSRGKRARG